MVVSADADQWPMAVLLTAEPATAAGVGPTTINPIHSKDCVPVRRGYGLSFYT